MIVVRSPILGRNASDVQFGLCKHRLCRGYCVHVRRHNSIVWVYWVPYDACRHAVCISMLAEKANLWLKTFSGLCQVDKTKRLNSRKSGSDPKHFEEIMSNFLSLLLSSLLLSLYISASHRPIKALPLKSQPAIPLPPSITHRLCLATPNQHTFAYVHTNSCCISLIFTIPVSHHASILLYH